MKYIQNGVISKDYDKKNKELICIDYYHVNNRWRCMQM